MNELKNKLTKKKTWIVYAIHLMNNSSDATSAMIRLTMKGPWEEILASRYH